MTKKSPNSSLPSSQNQIDCQGQGIMEYLIISGLVAIFCLASLRELGKVLDKRTQALKSKVVENIKIN